MVRQESIREMRGMLTDVMKKKLSVIELYLPEREGQGVVEAQLEGILALIDQISEYVNTLLVESIDDRKTKCDGPARQLVTQSSA